MRVALLGLGTVGGGVWSLLRDLPSHFELVSVAARDAEKARALGVPPGWRGAVERARGGPDVAVEAARRRGARRFAPRRGPGSRLRRGHREQARARGARGRLELLARSRGARLRLGRRRRFRSGARARRATPAGRGAPRARRAQRHGQLRVGELASGQDLESALAGARARGLTERDASRDLDGRDAADKLRLIGSKLGLPGLSVERSGVDAADPGTPERAARARSRGRALRQVATLELESRPAARVELLELGDDDPLGALVGARNAVVIERRDGRSSCVEGIGAGRWPAAQAVLGDLLALARDRAPRRGDRSHDARSVIGFGPGPGSARERPPARSAASRSSRSA